MFIEADTRCLSYLRVQVKYLLIKPLVPSMTIRIRGLGLMTFRLRYEHVPHFCFSYGRIGHAAKGCKSTDREDLGVMFSEELRATPPKRLKEVMLRRQPQNVARNLNFMERAKEKSTEASSMSAKPVRASKATSEETRKLNKT